MASNYPAAFDTFSTSHLDGEIIDEQTDNDQADALNKIERELGVNPSGGFNDLGTRIATLEFVIAVVGKGVVKHGNNASAARPAGFASIEWIGSVTPTNAQDGDTFVNTTGA